MSKITQKVQDFISTFEQLLVGVAAIEVGAATAKHNKEGCDVMHDW
jgi:hypothetical protein